MKSPFEVRHYRSSVKGRRPAPSSMSYGDLAINFNHEDPALIIKGDDNALVEFRPGAGVTVSATAPATPKENDLWWDSVSARLYLFYKAPSAAAGSWVDASPAAVPPTLANALTYKGAIDVTIAKPAALTPAIGDTYIVSKAGAADASWAGLTGGPVALHELIVWDGTEWAGAGAAASPRTAWQGKVDIGQPRPAGFTPVAGDWIEVTAAATVHADWAGLPTGTTVGTVLLYDGAAWLAVNLAQVATMNRLGAVQLADAASITAGTVGRVVDAAQLKAHTAPDATTAAKGLVQLADAAALVGGTTGRVVDAAQLKATAAACIPMNIASLTLLP